MKTGLTPAILHYVGTNPKCTNKEIATALGYDPNAMAA